MTKQPERVLVEAGAGCGKTTSIIDKFLTSLKNKKEGGQAYLPESCLLLTFTDAAAREMRARIKKKNPELNISSSFVGTFHSYCLNLLAAARLVDSQAKILSDEELSILIKDEFLEKLASEEKLSTLLSYVNLKELMNLALWGSENNGLMRDFEELENKWKTFHKGIERSLNSLDLEELDGQDWPHQALKLLEKDLGAHIKLSQKKVLKEIGIKNPQLLVGIKQLRNLQEKNILTPLLNLFEKEKEIFAFLSETLQSLRSRLTSHLTFSEIERRCLNGLREGKIKVHPLSLVIVDEFQDTSPEQWEIIEKISGAETEWYLVGDPKQSIYAFRKADIRLYKKLKEQIKVVELSTNYRSTPAILAATNKMQELFFSDALDPDPQSLKPGLDQKSLARSVVVNEFEDWDPELLLQRILERNTELPGKHHAALFREWKKLYNFADYLMKNNIPFQIQGSENYLEHFLTHTYLEHLRKSFEPAEGEHSPLHQDALAAFYEFCFLLEPERWPQGAEWASAMERLLLDLSEKDMKDWRKIAGLLVSGKVPTQSLNPPLRLVGNYQLSLLTIHGSKGLEFDFVYLADPRERVGYHGHFEEDEIPFTYAVAPQVKSRGLYHELQKIDRSFRYESEQKRLFYVAITRAKLGLDFFIPAESSRITPEEVPWWSIWRDEKSIKRFKWSQVIRGLDSADAHFQKLTPSKPKVMEESFFKAKLQSPERKLSEQRDNSKIRSAHQHWGDCIHQVLEYWNGDLTQLSPLVNMLPLTHNLPDSEKKELCEIAQKVRVCHDLDHYWKTVSGVSSDWVVLREEAFIEQSPEDESFRYADVLMLQKDEAIILDWKSSLRHDLLTHPERLEKIKSQLGTYARALRPKVKKVTAIAIGISRTTQEVKKILEVEF